MSPDLYEYSIVQRFAAHGNHAKGKLTKRHHVIRDVIYNFFTHAVTANSSPLDVVNEAWLDDFGICLLPEARDDSRARCDVLITKLESNCNFFTKSVSFIPTSTRTHPGKPVLVTTTACVKCEKLRRCWDERQPRSMQPSKERR